MLIIPAIRKSQAPLFKPPLRLLVPSRNIKYRLHTTMNIKPYSKYFKSVSAWKANAMPRKTAHLNFPVDQKRKKHNKEQLHQAML